MKLASDRRQPPLEIATIMRLSPLRPRFESLEDRRLMATITVNTTSDSATITSALTFRQAIEVVNGTLTPSQLSAAQQAQISGSLSQPDTIDFDIPGTGVQTIEPTSTLPNINKPVTINGYSQPGSSPNTLVVGDNAKILIQLDGQDAGATTTGLFLGAGNSEVEGLVVNRFGTPGSGGGGVGIFFADDPGSNLVWGDIVGLDPTGMISEPDSARSVVFAGGTGDTLGGSQPGARNIIQVGGASPANVEGVECDNENQPLCSR